jgi:AcrR family transcriptional regulator
MEKGGRPADNSAESTETRILKVATRHFYDRGYHGTTMREIAADCGMKAGSLYNHYTGKEELLFRIANDTMAELVDGAQTAVDQGTTPAQRLQGLVRQHVRYHAVNRLQAKVADDQLHALSQDRQAVVLKIRDGYERLVEEVIADGISEHGWAVADVKIVAFALLTMCTAVGTWFREDGRLSADQIADIYTDLAMAMLQP